GGFLEAAAFQQRFEVWVTPGEILEQTQRIGRSATREQFFPEEIAILAGQPAVLFEILHRVGVEHFAPDIGIVAGRITTGECVRKIKAAITRRYRWKIDVG